MKTKHYDLRQYHIVDIVGKIIDACAQFDYKGYQISMSTMGINKGGLHQAVCIFYNDLNDQKVFKDGFNTVADAIKFIDDYDYVSKIDKDTKVQLKAQLFNAIEFF